jgi:hypothetical protein
MNKKSKKYVYDKINSFYIQYVMSILDLESGEVLRTVSSSHPLATLMVSLPLPHSFPHQSDKLAPDPYSDPHQSDKLDPDPHQFADDTLKCMEYVPI